MCTEDITGRGRHKGSTVVCHGGVPLKGVVVDSIETLPTVPNHRETSIEQNHGVVHEDRTVESK